MKNRTLLIFLFVTCTITINAENVYIRSDANGNNSGTDWDNALVALPWRYEWIRGNTYYIADGEYNAGSKGSFELRTEVDQSKYIVIKKATEKDHGTSVGWDSTYGDGTAEFIDNIVIYTSYWIFDGVTGFDDGTIQHYGFKVTNTDPVTGNRQAPNSDHDRQRHG